MTMKQKLEEAQARERALWDNRSRVQSDPSSTVAQCNEAQEIWLRAYRLSEAISHVHQECPELQMLADLTAAVSAIEERVRRLEESLAEEIA